MRKYTKVQATQVKEMYNSGNTVLDMGIDFKPKSNRKYFCNELFFETFTAESCYWAGFIAADGCLYKNGLSINLQIGDIEHLCKFKKSLNFTGNVGDLRPKREACLIRINSKKIINDLIQNFNIIPKKSLTLKPPTKLPNNMIHHFIRGFLDGDGCYFTNSGERRYSISAVGTYEMLFWVKTCLKDGAKIRDRKVFKVSNNSFGFQANGGAQCRAIIEFLYADINDDIILKRKYEKTFTFFDLIKKQRDEERTIIELYNNGLSINYIIRTTSFKYYKIFRVLTGAGIHIKNGNKAKLTENDQLEILKLRNLGFTVKEISKKTTISHPRVSLFLHLNSKPEIQP